jgi:hypothetical protein
VWNAAQALAGPQVAVGANSPLLFGRELWRETRPLLFQQPGRGRAGSRVVASGPGRPAA